MLPVLFYIWSQNKTENKIMMSTFSSGQNNASLRQKVELLC